MKHQPPSRMDWYSLLTSYHQARTIRQLKKKVAALTHDKKELQQLIIQMEKRTQQKDQQLDKLQQALEALTARLDESKAREEAMLQAAKESKAREKEMLAAQKESKPILESIYQFTKPGLYALVGTTLIGDLTIDIYKEVIKKMIGEERLEAWGRLIRSWIGPELNAVLDTVELCFPTFLFILKTAITILVIAAPVLNLTVVVWGPLRAGLGKLRSKKASKK